MLSLTLYSTHSHTVPTAGPTIPLEETATAPAVLKRRRRRKEENRMDRMAKWNILGTQMRFVLPVFRALPSRGGKTRSVDEDAETLLAIANLRADYCSGENWARFLLGASNPIFLFLLLNSLQYKYVAPPSRVP